MSLALSILCCAGALALWSLVCARLDSWRVTGPLALAVSGVIIGLFVRPEIATVLNYHETEQIVELILAGLLFSDALVVRGQVLGSAPAVSLRLLFVAMPLSIVLAAGVCWLVMPEYGLAIALLIACIVMPVDMAPAASILTDNRLSLRVRSALNVESGYNDGVVAPIFLFVLAVVTAGSVASVSTSIGKAFMASAISVGVGVVVGFGFGLLSKYAVRKNWSTDQSTSIGILTVPLVTFSLAIVFGGNGFVAAFVAGISIHLCMGREAEHHAELTKQVVEVTALVLWFVFGVVAVYIVYLGLDWRIIVLSVLALTVFRAAPVALALMGSPLSRTERAATSILGPRGITTIVLGLLAFNAIDDETDVIVLQAMIVTVFLGLVMHGLGSSPITALLTRSEPASTVAHPISGSAGRA